VANPRGTPRSKRPAGSKPARKPSVPSNNSLTESAARPVLFVHWHADEARHLAGILASAGIRSELWRDSLKLSEVRAMGPRACVISLRRLPSHGRAVAEALQSTQWGRAIPLIFLDGDPERLSICLDRFPSANHTTLAALPQLLAAMR